MRHLAGIRRICFHICWLLLPCVVQASEIDRLLTAQVPPAGVVFEIVQDDPDDLNWAIPQVEAYTERLRRRFPSIDIALVSHGAEMFALQESDRPDFLGVHQSVEKLGNAGVDVHVCGTHASWYGADDSAFPDYVDVAPSGPAQINHYLELGYTLIVIRQP